jgi:hypothetical protein
LTIFADDMGINVVSLPGFLFPAGLFTVVGIYDSQLRVIKAPYWFCIWNTLARSAGLDIFIAIQI